jgi:hypothetical protein
MASEKQLAANRANAKKSSGPKTTAGKLTSSRNARRHGLSIPLAIDTAASSEAAALARALADGVSSANEPAMDYAQAHIKLKHIQDERNRLMAAFDADQPDVRTLRRVAALDRYERYQNTKRRRAARGL